MKSAVTSKASEQEVADALRQIVGTLQSQDLASTASVVLVGSAARHARQPGSDIDVMVVSDEKPQFDHLPYDVHVQTLTRREFVDRLCRRDDFALWAIRYGEPVTDPAGWFARVRERPEARAWPDPAHNFKLAQQRLSMARELLDMGDEDAAREELLFALSHLARAMLLERGVFPLSRPELAGQLAEVGDDETSRMLDSVMRDTSLAASRLEDVIARPSRRLERERGDAR